MLYNAAVLIIMQAVRSATVCYIWLKYGTCDSPSMQNNSIDSRFV